MRKTFTAAALTAAAMAASVGSASAASPIPAGPAAFQRLTGLILPAPDSVTGSSVESGSALLSLRDTNGLNVMSDHSRSQITGTTGVQG